MFFHVKKNHPPEIEGDPDHETIAYFTESTTFSIIEIDDGESVDVVSAMLADGNDLPSFFSFDADTYKLTLKDTASVASTYSIKVKAKDDYNPTASSFVITWEIKENTSPHFDGLASPTASYLSVEEHVAFHAHSYTLPKFSDDEDETITPTVSLAGVSFGNLSPTDLKFTVNDSSTTNDDVGSYIFEVTLSDGHN